MSPLQQMAHGFWGEFVEFAKITGLCGAATLVAYLLILAVTTDE